MPLNETQVLNMADEIFKEFHKYGGFVQPHAIFNSKYDLQNDQLAKDIYNAAILKIERAGVVLNPATETGLTPSYKLNGLGKTIIPQYGSFSAYLKKIEKPSFETRSKKFYYPVAIGAALIASGGVVHSIITSSKADEAIEKLEERIESLESSLNKSTITLDSLKILTAPKDTL